MYPNTDRCNDPHCCPPVCHLAPWECALLSEDGCTFHPRNTRKRSTYTVTIQECANGTFTVTLTHSDNEYAASVTGVLDYATAAHLGEELVKVIC